MVLPLFDASSYALLSAVHVIEFRIPFGDLIDDLQYHHQCLGLCHRDIKPGILFLSIVCNDRDKLQLPGLTFQ
ncbi:hypothetical protein BCR33DRAFT_718426 [Rhizoclosmatium globosum]|uniref:Protein kinase domain-containing protein n=1 Tax=Rhizoclosmatium globosum TaxID=329046 RepID=A0A1Y2C5B7_9FUNG|nr:hypothetical protein BCR33DRAFT_718426 [Rhizoclosmatium globosum]|eukprot:ORY42228.1 hypothetical protein BCR33DRAFT_718426 [Rhizoclosmatium globosum]